MDPRRRTFTFAFDPRFRRLLWCLGITPAGSRVTIDDRGQIDARFGPWQLRTTIDNVSGTQVTGPYRAWRAIGPHISLADRGLSFGSNLDRGLCIRFRDPVPGPATLGMIHHPGLTVTVAGVDGLAAAIAGTG